LNNSILYRSALNII